MGAWAGLPLNLQAIHSRNPTGLPHLTETLTSLRFCAAIYVHFLHSGSQFLKRRIP